MSGIRDQRSKVRGQGSEIRGQGSGVRDWKVEVGGRAFGCWRLEVGGLRQNGMAHRGEAGKVG